MDEAMRLVSDYALCKNAKDLTVQLGPIRRGLNRLQGDSATLADAVEVWMDLGPYCCLYVRKLFAYLRKFGIFVSLRTQAIYVR